MNFTLIWDVGTAYDLFVSLLVLYKPNKFGLRGAWAKGVRTRLPADSRNFFAQLDNFFLAPLPWVTGLPAPKDGRVVLEAVSQTPPAERLSFLTLASDTPPEIVGRLEAITARGKWKPEDQEALKAAQRLKRHPLSAEDQTKLLNWWAHPQAFGEQYLQALTTYYRVFFAEEEARIAPALEEAMHRAQARAEKMPWPELLEELSQGVRLEAVSQIPRWVIAPSYWASPLIVISEISQGTNLFLFGARAADSSLVPGEWVPDALFRALKALADPTRLRILHHLSRENLTPSELARRLRLRAPTVVHHLNTLRLAGLVYLTFVAEGDRRYAARLSKVDETWTFLQAFLREGNEDQIEEPEV